MNTIFKPIVDWLRKSAAQKDEVRNRIAGAEAEQRVKENDQCAKLAMLTHMLTKQNKL